MPVDKNCIICGENDGGYQSLLNGTRFHPACYEDLSEVYISTRDEIRRINSEKCKLKNETNESYSLLGKFKNIFKGSKVNIPKIESDKWGRQMGSRQRRQMG